jgi:tetratricopeptide (TPR) repeat protein
MLAALAVGASPSLAQIELGVLHGVVTDEAGNPLEGVTFRIRDVERGRQVEIKSDKNGRFYRRGLAGGEYELVVEKEGYKPIHDKIRLTTADRGFDFKLVKAAPEGAEEFAKGVAAFNQGNFQAAAEAFEASVKKAPDLPEVRVNLALAYLRLKRTPDAVAELERAAALSKGEARVLFQLGEVHLELNELDKAAASIEKGLTVAKPDDPDAFEATVTLGAVYFAKGDNDKAQAQFEKALSARPTAVTPKLGLGKVYASKGDVDKALQLFREVLAASAPGSPEARDAEAFIKELEQSKRPAA